MDKLLIIADDLTGANDTGVQFAKKEIPALVLTEAAEDLRPYADESQVLVVNTESRHLAGARAAERVRRTTAAALAAGVTHFYKKIDSSLRGNVGAELEALMIASGRPKLPFVPAYPKLNRTTRDGRHYVDGAPLHQTVFARDPLEPLEESYVPALLEKQMSARAFSLTAARLRTTSSPFGADGVYVLDASTDRDLEEIGVLLRKENLLGAVAGSAGFAEHLPDLLQFEKRPAPRKNFDGNMLIISGSVNETSLGQLAHAERCGFAAVTLPPAALVSGVDSPAARQAIDEALELGARGKDVILRSSRGAEDVDECLRLGRAANIETKQLHLRVAENLARAGGRILRGGDFKLVTVFGGDTLAALARAQNWSGLLPVREIMPGVVVSAVAGWEDELLLITKAGGFGEADALTQIKRLVRRVN